MAKTMSSSGYLVDLESPDPATINLFDIARHLAKINRFAGATVLPYSVAQHSVLVANIIMQINTPRLALWGLLHDAHEAYFGDITAPVRRVFGVPIAPLEKMDHAIAQALDVPYPSTGGHMIIKQCDKKAFALEWRDLMPGAPPDDTLPCPSGFPGIKPMVWDKAEDLFLKTFDKLCIAAGCGKTGL